MSESSQIPGLREALIGLEDGLTFPKFTEKFGEIVTKFTHNQFIDTTDCIWENKNQRFIQPNGEPLDSNRYEHTRNYVKGVAMTLVNEMYKVYRYEAHLK